MKAAMAVGKVQAACMYQAGGVFEVLGDDHSWISAGYRADRVPGPAPCR
jgi:hypothetical protein